VRHLSDERATGTASARRRGRCVTEVNRDAAQGARRKKDAHGRCQWRYQRMPKRAPTSRPPPCSSAGRERVGKSARGSDRGAFAGALPVRRSFFCPGSFFWARCSDRTLKAMWQSWATKRPVENKWEEGWRRPPRHPATKQHGGCDGEEDDREAAHPGRAVLRSRGRLHEPEPSGQEPGGVRKH